MTAAKKKRIHANEVIMRKKKREEDKIIKELKKTSKFKRFYRQRLQTSSISIFSTLQTRENASEIEKTILQMKKSEVDSSASSMRNYTYD